jgi:hypothetical protein
MHLLSILFAVLRSLRNLANFPEDVTDEAAVRNWFRSIAAAVAALGAALKVPAVETLARVLTALVENDDVWALVYGLIVRLMAAPSTPILAAMDGPDAYGPELMALAVAMERRGIVGITPLAILELIAAILALLKSLQQQRAAILATMGQ